MSGGTSISGVVFPVLPVADADGAPDYCSNIRVCEWWPEGVRDKCNDIPQGICPDGWWNVAAGDEFQHCCCCVSARVCSKVSGGFCYCLCHSLLWRGQSSLLSFSVQSNPMKGGFDNFVFFEDFSSSNGFDDGGGEGGGAPGHLRAPFLGHGPVTDGHFERFVDLCWCIETRARSDGVVELDFACSHEALTFFILCVVGFMFVHFGSFVMFIAEFEHDVVTVWRLLFLLLFRGVSFCAWPVGVARFVFVCVFVCLVCFVKSKHGFGAMFQHGVIRFRMLVPYVSLLLLLLLLFKFSFLFGLFRLFVGVVFDWICSCFGGLLLVVVSVLWAGLCCWATSGVLSVLLSSWPLDVFQSFDGR